MTERIIFADCEGDDFLEDLTTMWTIQIALDEDAPVIVYADQPGYPSIKEGLSVLAAADKIVFHFGLGFDFWAINKLYPGTLRWEQIIDSVVLSRLIDSTASRHSLHDLGEALGFPKGKFDDFSKFSEEMVTYGIQDVKIIQKAWKGVPGKSRVPFGKFYEKYRRACDLEMKIAYICQKQSLYGVNYDYQAGLELEGVLREEKMRHERELQVIFPPITIERYSEKQRDKLTGKPKRLKDEVIIFNPGSGDQIEDRLVAKYGWKPIKKTPTGRAKVDEEILGGLPYPEAQAIAIYKKAVKKLGQICDGENGWAKVAVEQPDGTYRIHGQVNTLGARTHRMAHFKPNTANVDTDPRMRALWLADNGWVMVGTDAEGLELRMLSHYLYPYDGGAYGRFVHLGDKKLGTDVHTVNQKAAGLYSRDSAKTMIYAHNYGCFDKKLGQIVLDDARDAGKSPPTGQVATIGLGLRKKLEKGVTGLGELITKCKRIHGEKKALPGLDGRWIPSASDHSALNTLLQGNGSVVMKEAVNHFEDEMIKLGILDKLLFPKEGRFGYLLNVHDEWQVTCHPDVAEKVAEVGKWAITKAGETLGVRCPLVGDAKIGKNWAETH